MPEQPGAGRLDAETLAAYVEGLLPPEERAKVDAEIAADPENYEWLVNSINAVDDDSIGGVGDVPVRPVSSERGLTPTPTPTPAHVAVHGTTPSRGLEPRGGSDIPAKVLPFYRRRAVMAGVGVLVAAAASLLLVVQLQPEWYQRWRGPQVDPRFAKLVEAVGEERYIEARLTGGFKYGPLRQVMRGTAGASARKVDLLAIAVDAERDVRARPTVSNLHLLGVAEVLVGGDKVSTGVEHLREALHLSDEPILRSDLAAGYLAKYSTAGDEADLTSALEQADLALAQDSQLPAALFNRALALTLLERRSEAIAAWSVVASSSREESWGEEARRQIGRLAMGAR